MLVIWNVLYLWGTSITKVGSLYSRKEEARIFAHISTDHCLCSVFAKYFIFWVQNVVEIWKFFLADVYRLVKFGVVHRGWLGTHPNFFIGYIGWNWRNIFGLNTNVGLGFYFFSSSSFNYEFYSAAKYHILNTFCLYWGSISTSSVDSGYYNNYIILKKQEERV